jgi:two-component system chemotaxis response regulator CheB
MGASAGGVDALLKVLGDLPGDLPHAICVVLHLPATGSSVLAQILDRNCAMTVRTAAEGARLVPGHVYVAPPDRHLLVGDGRIELTSGPKENGVRPAVDALLRTLAGSYGPQSVAVVLSGALGDGSIGAREVASAGGQVIVQDPADALVPSMPERAIALVGDGAVILPADRIGAALVALRPARRQMREDALMTDPDDRRQGDMSRPEGGASAFTCPECGGPLWEHQVGDSSRFRCRIGHVYSEDAMIAEQGTGLETALWTALEALDERAELLRRTAERRARSHPHVGRRLAAAAVDAQERAALIRRALAGRGDGDDAFAVDVGAESAS